MRKPSNKILAIVLVGSLLFIPVNPREAYGNMLGRIVSKVVYGATNTVINSYKVKKKLPIVAGYKKGKDPLPKGTNATQTYKNIWAAIKNDLGIK